MLKLGAGDLLMITFGLIAILFMVIIGPGKNAVGDPASDRRSDEAFVKGLSKHLSPVLAAALIAGLSAVCYVLVAVYFKSL